MIVFTPCPQFGRLFTLFSLVVTNFALAFAAATAAGEDRQFRPPATPLVACDPYFSIWSGSDLLSESTTVHWTGKPHPLAALVRVDGVTLRLMGIAPPALAAMKQTSLKVLPTRTLFSFASEAVEVKLTFTTPALPDDVAVLGRPTTYVNCEVKSADGRPHEVEFYFDAGGELAVNEPQQTVSGERVATANSVALKLGTVSQRILGKAGDDLRIDWGYLYVAADKSASAALAFGKAHELRTAFAEAGAALPDQAPAFPVAAEGVVAAAALPLGKVGRDPVSRYVLLAYDDLYSIEFMKQRLRPYWRKEGWEASNLLTAAVREHDQLERRCATFDEQLTADLQRLGGQEYAEIATLAYRQCFAAGKFVADANGQPLQFCKENHSNGCIATSDVFYPMAPQFLLFGPTLTKSFLVPFMEYAASERWKFPFAPHDLGTYPKANGQRYGGGEKTAENQMPVEESGNLLLLCGALAQMEGNADFSARYWKQLSQWAAYLREKGFDPENQLCTDDFAGHMAHNVNLSAKAICALGAYAQLCQRRGLADEAATYRQAAEGFAAQWVAAARDGDHYKLAFDRPGSWSQKYNLVWDRVLRLRLFPDEVYATEMAFYRRTQNEFGLPLDNRSDYTKLDWILWTATLTEKQEDFAALVRPVHHFLNTTPNRSPMTDWYFTSTGRKRGFTARPVVGGVFLKLLYDRETWHKYASQDTTRATGWAALPTPPKTVPLVATGAAADAPCRFTIAQPGDSWFAVDFDAASWNEGHGGLGTRGTPQAPVGTEWKSSDIWLRRTFSLDKLPPGRPVLRIWHDEEAQVYLNGKLAVELEGFTTDYELAELPAGLLRAGENVVAIHCRQTIGGQFIDFGLDQVISEAPNR